MFNFSKLELSWLALLEAKACRHVLTKLRVDVTTQNFASRLNFIDFLFFWNDVVAKNVLSVFSKVLC